MDVLNEKKRELLSRLALGKISRTEFVESSVPEPNEDFAQSILEHAKENKDGLDVQFGLALVRWTKDELVLTSIRRSFAVCYLNAGISVMRTLPLVWLKLRTRIRLTYIIKRLSLNTITSIMTRHFNMQGNALKAFQQ